MQKFSGQFYCEFDRFCSVKIVDDGRVAYAYFTQGDDAVGDVWLYNQAEAPKVSFWNPADIPFLNPVEYLNKDAKIAPINAADEVRCEWLETSDGIIEVDILIRGKFIAQLSPGAKPGFSVLVVKDGPLALIY
ncbi:hypothetical protein [Mucilaginibacter glaciei]|uniref:Uncharacterized protein n=1 Tax=Mucilaginibacter glaciei TaxID=2772109 RepID=A0A926NP20_9SPHI|nr:hypothetical protein [Mucilaginibacter glaciei]MBD1392432.1 hypothetical protein [Mucilaginibacter glaciei]